MKKLTCYLDTSVFNFILASDSPREQEVTNKFLKVVAPKSCELYISDVVIEEISAAPTTKAAALVQLLKDCNPIRLPLDAEIRELAQEYIAANLIPAKYLNDALHAAAASYHGMDVLLSWNMEHLVKLKTRRGINAINLLKGFHSIEIATPMEVNEE